jgi:hypothetical protein
MNLHKQKYKKTFTVNLQDFKEKLKEYKSERRKKEQLKQEQVNEQNRIIKFENNIDQISTKKRMDYIDKILNKKEFEKYLNILLKELE